MFYVPSINVEWVTGKTEPTEKFEKLNRWKICVSRFLSAERSQMCRREQNITVRHYEKIEKWLPNFGGLVI